MCCRNNRRQRHQNNATVAPTLFSMSKAAYESYKTEKAKSLERQQFSQSPGEIDSAYNSSSSRASRASSSNNKVARTKSPVSYSLNNNNEQTSHTHGSSIDSAIADIGSDGQQSKRESRQECINRHLSALAALDLSGTATPDETASDPDLDYDPELDIKSEKELLHRGRRRQPKTIVPAAPPPRYEDVVDLASVNDKLAAVSEQQREGSSASEADGEIKGLTWRERWAEKKAERAVRREERWAAWEARRTERRVNGGGYCGRRC